MKTITLNELRDLCREFDKQWGRYPEDQYEGFSVYDFIEGRLNGEHCRSNDAPDDWPEK